MKIDIHRSGTLSMVMERMADIVIRNGRVIKNRCGDCWGNKPDILMPRNMITVGNGRDKVVLYFEDKLNLLQALQNWIDIEKSEPVER